MSAARPLTGCRILVVEDEYFIAQQIATTLADAGADVVGPVPTLEKALLAIDDASLNAAILDINLRGEKVFPVADRLVGRGIPFLFATSYDQAVIPARFADVRRCDKPPSLADVQRALGL